MRFTKMQGLGNDFMVLDGLNQSLRLDKNTLERLADRRFGVGFDQCLVIEATTKAGADFKYRIFNRDGSEVGQCGNGARCVARFIKEQGLLNREFVRLETLTTTLKTKVHHNNDVSLWLPAASFKANEIPIHSHSNAPPPHQLDYQGRPLVLYCLTVGNPHAIIVIDDFSQYDLEALGGDLNQHAFFPEGVNVSLLKQHSNTTIEIRTFERGSGITLACGSAATAAFSVAHLFLGGEAKGEVKLARGALYFNWQNTSEAIEMRGPAKTVYQGEVTEL